MSILSELGTKIGTELKTKLDVTAQAADSNKLNGLESNRFMSAVNSYLTDANMLTAGSYRLDAGALNSPDSSRYFAMIVYGNNSNVTSQIATDFVTGKMYVRSFNNSWCDWVEIGSTTGSSYSFNMTLSGTQNNYTDTVNSAIPFNYLLAGSMTGWSTSTYRWTASVAGTYLVSVMALIAASKAFEIQIMKNTGYAGRVYTSSGRQVSGSVLIDLEVGDYVYVRAPEACYLHTASPYTTLTITYQP